jgi:hypothetical protein
VGREFQRASRAFNRELKGSDIAQTLRTFMRRTHHYKAGPAKELRQKHSLPRWERVGVRGEWPTQSSNVAFIYLRSGGTGTALRLQFQYAPLLLRLSGRNVLPALFTQQARPLSLGSSASLSSAKKKDKKFCCKNSSMLPTACSGEVYSFTCFWVLVSTSPSAHGSCRFAILVICSRS